MRRASCVVFLLALAGPIAAQVAPSGSWRTLHSQHFRIHFRPEYRALAVEAAAEAERAYALLSGELRAPRGTIDLTLADDVDSPNGFASTYPSNRIAILLVPPVADPGLRDFDSWQRLVIVHELTHIFHLDRSRRLWKTMQSVFGRVPGTFPNQYQPSWVSEGIATYYESRFTARGRADGGFHRQIVAADVMQGQARSPWDAMLFTRWPGGFAPYAYGSRFWDFLSRDREGGDSLAPRFIERSAGQLIPFRIGRPLKSAGADLAGEWTRAAAAAVPVHTPGSSGRTIVASLRTQPVPRVSPDGRHIAYVHDDGHGARRLRVIDAASLLEQRSRRVTGQVSYDWVGDTLIVAQLDVAGRWQVRSDLWSWLPPPDGRWIRLSTGGRLSEPRAGGGLVTALRLGPGDNAPVAIGFAAPMPDSAGADVIWGAAAPSPDGSWIAASRHARGRWELVRWRVTDPESVEVLAAPAGGVSDPGWSGEGGGTDILFVSDAGGVPQIHRWTRAGRIEQITDEPLGARAPAILPDGRVLFTTLNAAGWALRSATPSPRAVREMPSPPPFDSAPPVAVRETGYAKWPSLRPHFWIPLAFNAGDAGFFFGAATAGGDAVGRYSYVAEALVAPSPLRAQGAFALVSHALGDPTLDFYAASDWSLVGIDSATGAIVSTEHREATLGATVLARRWYGFVALRLGADYEGRRYAVEPDTSLADICPGCRPRDLVGATASLSFGSAVGAPLAVSLQDGFNASFLYRRREEQGTARWLNEVRGRVAVYARFGPRIGFAYPVLALRIAAGAFDGPIVERLAVGGVSSGALALPFGQELGTARSFPVRGYRAGTLRGRRAASVSAEYRMPLALIGKSLGHLPFGADKLSFALFGDMGDAWDPGQDEQLHRLRSVGVELIGDLTVSYDLPLRVRIGIAQPHGRRLVTYAAFAADF